MELIEKIAILSDAAKYDASCASSGSQERNSKNSKGVGSTSGMGICHSYTPDGRCISLLKILLTNFCIYDCLYCVNRHSSNVARARFSVDEVVSLCLEFYKRNYIEGLFLSSGIIQSPDYTMEQLVLVAKKLRHDFDFQGYIHLKTIPDADPALLAMAGLYADRLSINIELPSISALNQLAPEKNHQAIGQSMATIHQNIQESREDQRLASNKKSVVTLPASKPSIALGDCLTPRPIVKPVKSTVLRKKSREASGSRKPLRYAPGGQSTQMIVGADDSSDHKILLVSDRLYRQFQMRRVYYSAFSPIPDASQQLPLRPPPLLREHRLYQADWLMRFYGFNINELFLSGQDKMLDLKLDPKLTWALNHRHLFPLDINKASRELLLRIPGIGPRNVKRILNSRRFSRLSLRDLGQMRVSLHKVKPFIITADHVPDSAILDSEHLHAYFERPIEQQLMLL